MSGAGAVVLVADEQADLLLEEGWPHGGVGARVAVGQARTGAGHSRNCLRVVFHAGAVDSDRCLTVPRLLLLTVFTVNIVGPCC